MTRGDAEHDGKVSLNYPGDGYNAFDGEHESTASRSSCFTANPLAREPRMPTPWDSDDNASISIPGRPGSLRSQYCSGG